MRVKSTSFATMFVAALTASGAATADEAGCFYNGGGHLCVWYPGYAIAHRALAEIAPLTTGRSVAVSDAILPVSGGAAGAGIIA
ncbi:hypothetical protein Msil_2759 [Methylocella silvestris BL2]|uniref:Porin n=1 Tax=Methylocella silvestris (strain DSM 15510 / CIP 108128 / LMG 27833 / NCIMB 13906 / BL2) TaxID=395965 RepID=B8ERY2_METSB|nr:hypothetical protein [Methylocella silvestris]ACK51680.1 hypothetical protein Msil_2759 [Methylocella silvestris BL2]